MTETSKQISNAAWVYRGFTIRTIKKAGLPLYYAWVYKNTGDYGFKVDRDDEPAETRERVVQWAQWEIDDHYKDDSDVS